MASFLPENHAKIFGYVETHEGIARKLLYIDFNNYTLFGLFCLTHGVSGTKCGHARVDCSVELSDFYSTGIKQTRQECQRSTPTRTIAQLRAIDDNLCLACLLK